MSLNEDLMEAVFNNDPACVLHLIEQGADVNFSNSYGETPLHRTVSYERNRHDILALLINQADIKINPRNVDGSTPLMLSIQQEDLFAVERLLEKGCDVNVTDDTGESPLHVAVRYERTDFVEMLLNNHADVNIADEEGFTPLNLAVVKDNVEAIYMLLASGADIYLKNSDGLMLAFVDACSMGYELADMAFVDSYSTGYELDDMDFVDACLIRSYELADILMDHCDFNYDDINIFLNDEYTFKYLLQERNIELFEFIWPRLSHRLLQERFKHFIGIYVADCKYPNATWIEYLYLMLTLELPMQLSDFGSPDCTSHCSFVGRLFGAFQRRRIEWNDRLSIIYTLLSSGVEICYHNFNQAFELYGFSDELEAFLSTGSICTEIDKLDNVTLSTFILAGETDYSSLTISKLFDNHLYGLGLRYNPSNRVLHVPKFFFVSSDIKARVLKQYCDDKFYFNKDFVNKFNELPNLPSLLELCRNRVRLYIKRKNNVRKSYQFHDAVMKLPIPDKMKDIIRFKMPIYEV